MYNNQDLEIAKYALVDEWIKKLWYIYMMEYYIGVKKEALTYIF